MSGIREFLEKHFNELLLLWLLVVIGGLVFYFAKTNHAKGLDWAIGTFANVLGALLLLLRIKPSEPPKS